jgi:monothiol glutaredoxin
MDITVHERIRHDVADNGGALQKASVFPQCGFSRAVVNPESPRGQIQRHHCSCRPGNSPGDQRVLNWPTIPQHYVKGEFVGGCDIIREMYETGELQQVLEQKGVPVRA